MGEAGVTVVIPAARGADALSPTLRSLTGQTLDPRRFEVVVVVNGPAAAERRRYEALRDQFPRMAIRLVLTATGSASLAWNLGVQAARMEWLTFVDDDDTVTPPFLAALLDVARPGVVPLAEIHDVRVDRSVDEATNLNRRIRGAAGTTVPASRIPQAFGFNASKLVPTRWAKECRYDLDLPNGQDIGFFGSLSLRHDIVLAVPADSRAAAYHRTVSAESMSRQPMSFEFSIEQRLGVIAALDASRPGSLRRRLVVADHLVLAQVAMMNAYLRAHPDRRADVLRSIRGRRLDAFPYPALNHGLATALVVIDGSPGSDQGLRSWACSRTEPFDVLLVGPPGTDDRWWRPRPGSGPEHELAARRIRAVGGRSGRRDARHALAALERLYGPVLPYTEVTSVGGARARRVARAIAHGRPGMSAA